MPDASPSTHPPAMAQPATLATACAAAAGEPARRNLLLAALSLLAWLAGLGLLQQCSRLPDAAEQALLLGTGVLLLALWTLLPRRRP